MADEKQKENLEDIADLIGEDTSAEVIRKNILLNDIMSKKKELRNVKEDKSEEREISP